VIAYGAGGALSTVVEGLTGLFFYEQAPEALVEVVAGFQDEYFDPLAIRRHAEEFDTQVFLRRLSHFLDDQIAVHPALARRSGNGNQAPMLPAAALRPEPSGEPHDRGRRSWPPSQAEHSDEAASADGASDAPTQVLPYWQPSGTSQI
jgi:hypothetical protein